ncbi:MAG: ABC transporter ATP-binding protein [Collinsella sp.]|nr:ABC transporter ATP-binding protein [Collinsella sp.]
MITTLLSLLDSRSALKGSIFAHALSGVLQGIALALLVPFLSAFLSNGAPDPLWLVPLLIAVVLAMAASIAGSVIAFRVASIDMCGTLIRKVGARVQELPLGWFDAGSTGRVTTATSTSISLLSHLPSIVIPKLVSTVGSALVLLLATLYYDWRMGLAIAVSIPIALWALRLLRKAVVREHRAEEEAMTDLSSRILEFARLQPVLRATGALEDGWGPLEGALRREHETTRRAGLAKGPAGALFHAGVQIPLVLALGIGAFRMLGGALDETAFIALALMAVRFAEPAAMLAFYVDPLHQSQVALDGISAIIDAPGLPEPAEDEARLPSKPLDVVFDDVSFSYTPDRPVLEHLDITLPAESVTALVGPSGSGKSTVLRLIARFWDADSGSIRIGGEDVRAVCTPDLMNMVSMVFQDVYLFDTSIEENVRIGRSGASDEEVAAAAARAGLTEVVDRLPEGWKTLVGEGGSALSGGERQRVAIARAFLKDAPVLLLDEVTSALDGVNEASVTRALSELSKGRTVLVIAHRLSTIRRADRIVVLRDGRIEAIGGHEELYETDGTYREFWDDQAEVERWRISRREEAR